MIGHVACLWNAHRLQSRACWPVGVWIGMRAGVPLVRRPRFPARRAVQRRNLHGQVTTQTQGRFEEAPRAPQPTQEEVDTPALTQPGQPSSRRLLTGGRTRLCLAGAALGGTTLDPARVHHVAWLDDPRIACYRNLKDRELAAGMLLRHFRREA